MIITVLEKNQEKIFQNYKKECLTAAYELFYGDEVLEKIRNSETEPELIRIMIAARHAAAAEDEARLQLFMQKGEMYGKDDCRTTANGIG